MGDDLKTAQNEAGAPDKGASGDIGAGERTAASDVPPERAGRKRGAKGKYDDRLADRIREDYGRSPAEELARRAFMAPRDYAVEAHLTKGKGDKKVFDVGRAFDKQTGILKALLPYTERKMPTEVEVTDQKRVILQIGTIGAPEGVEAAPQRTIELVPANISKSQQNQRHSLAPAEKSDSAKSDERR